MLDGQGPVLVAVSVGGAAGALARWGVGAALPGAGPWPTLAINVLGCLLIGLLVALVARFDAPALTRPLLGTGVLGGFTTFSGYAVDGVGLLVAGNGPAAAIYLGATLAGAVLATWLGLALGRHVPGGQR
ncbi:MAG: fluoride efflux transporter FluC [Pseudonocardia sp.]